LSFVSSTCTKSFSKFSTYLTHTSLLVKQSRYLRPNTVLTKTTPATKP
jgi:hypothetical protein